MLLMSSQDGGVGACNAAFVMLEFVHSWYKKGELAEQHNRKRQTTDKLTLFPSVTR